MGKIIYGNENLGYAPITNLQGAYGFGTPVMLTGMVSANASLEENTSNIYADNKVWCVISGAKIRSVNIGLKYIPESYAELLGYKIQSNGMLTDTGATPDHCLFFETIEKDCETDEETRTLHYFYKVKGKTPNIETSTSEETPNEETISIEYTSKESDFVVDGDGKKVGYGYITRTEANKNIYDTFKTGVILPTATL